MSTTLTHPSPWCPSTTATARRLGAEVLHIIQAAHPAVLDHPEVSAALARAGTPHRGITLTMALAWLEHVQAEVKSDTRATDGHPGYRIVYGLA